MNKIRLLIICLIGLSSCKNEIKFDKTKWALLDDMEYPYRDRMVEDLTENYKLVGIKYSELVNLLGTPQQTDSNTVFYQISIHYNIIDPDYTKDISFRYNADSIITQFRVTEWKN